MPKTQHQHEAGEPALRPGTNPTRRRERLRDDRGLRKNTARPETGDPIAKTMNTAGLRHPEASQPHEGKPTRPWQKTRVTHTSTKPRRADNQGLSATTPSYQQKTGSERKNPRKELKKNSRSLDNHTVGTAKRKQPGQGKEFPIKRRQEPRQDRSPPTQVQQTPKEETQRGTREGRGCDQKPRRQNGTTETPEEPNTQELQVGPQTCDQTTRTPRAGEGQTETWTGWLTTKGSRDCKLRS